MNDLYFRTPQLLIKRAKDLRKMSSLTERLLWSALRILPEHKHLNFRRQHPVKPYIADFASVKIKLIVELDGESHDVRQSYDADRDNFLNSHGWLVLRFPNQQIYKNLEGVITTILQVACARKDALP